MYPLANRSCINNTYPANDLNFFYAKAPPLTLPPLDGLPNGPAAFNYLPFPYGAPYIPRCPFLSPPACRSAAALLCPHPVPDLHNNK